MRVETKRIVLSILTGIVLFGSGCGEKKESLPPAGNYREFIEVSSRLLCAKMLRCYEKLTRTVSPASQSELTPEKCSATATRDLDEKLALHTEPMKQLSVFCYTALLKAPCHRFALQAYWDPACHKLREESEKIYGTPR